MSPLSGSSGDLIIDRRFAYAQALAGAGDLAAASEVLEQALELAPGWAEGWLTLGDWRTRLGDAEGAAAAYRHAAVHDAGGRLGAGLRLAALGAAPTPNEMPPTYVRALFDDYAPRFDRALVERLSYRGPEVLAAALAPLGERRFATVLDLGCGTGLMGAAIRARADRLIGVDLSQEMLRIAAGKGIYDEIHTAEALAYLSDESDARFDLVLAADMLPYVGTLAPLFGEVARVLAPGGVFAFTGERHDGEGAALGEGLRFRHAMAFVEAAAAEAGLTLLSLYPAATRRERGEPVAGYVGLLVRPADILPLTPRPSGPAGPLPRAA